MIWKLNEDDVRGAIICQCIAKKWPEPQPYQITFAGRYSSYGEPFVTIDFDAKEPEDAK